MAMEGIGKPPSSIIPLSCSPLKLCTAMRSFVCSTGTSKENFFLTGIFSVFCSVVLSTTFSCVLPLSCILLFSPESDILLSRGDTAPLIAEMMRARGVSSVLYILSIS